MPVAANLARVPCWTVAKPKDFMCSSSDTYSTITVIEEADLMRAPSLSAAHALLDAVRPDIVVCGSSPSLDSRSKTPEQWLTIAARQLRIPTVGVLDYWGYYKERFFGAGGYLDLDLVPDKLCALDKVNAEDLRALGIPAERIVCTHNPALDGIVGSGGLPESRAIPGGRPTVIFASQPFRENAKSMGWTWTQTELFEVVAEGVCLKKDCRLVVWAHPSEDKSQWPPVLKRVQECFGLDVCLDPARGAQVLACADLMVTSHSTVSYEAALLAVPIVQFQPFDWLHEPTILERTGYAEVIKDSDTMIQYLRMFDSADRHMFSRERVRELRSEGVLVSDGLATKRVQDVVEELVGAQ